MPEKTSVHVFAPGRQCRLHMRYTSRRMTVLIVPLQHEPGFRQMERLLDVKGRRSQNWDRTSQDRLGKAGLEEFKALQADYDDAELAIRFQTKNQLVKVSHNELMPTLYVCQCVPHFSF